MVLAQALHNPSRRFWGRRRVLLTGHTGFKGSWLAIWLHRLGAEVTGIALTPNTEPSLFNLADLEVQTRTHVQDIRDAKALAAIVRQADPEIVFHLAAQPLVRASYSDPLGTFSTNVQGTANLLDTLRGCAATRVVVVITTDKVYQNLEHAYPYRETDTLGGHDPYSASKAAAELVIASYRDAFLKEQGVAVATARAGNVIGGGDWSEDRLIPDAVRAWSSQQPLTIRRPDAIRPWQHVLEPLSGYLQLAQQLWHNPTLVGAYNFGPKTHEVATVRTVVEQALSVYGHGEIIVQDNHQGLHEADCLMLEIAKARALLGVEPRWSLNDAIEKALSWYRDFAEGQRAVDLCVSDIAAFETSGSPTCTP